MVGMLLYLMKHTSYQHMANTLFISSCFVQVRSLLHKEWPISNLPFWLSLFDLCNVCRRRMISFLRFARSNIEMSFDWELTCLDIAPDTVLPLPWRCCWPTFTYHSYQTSLHSNIVESLPMTSSQITDYRKRAISSTPRKTPSSISPLAVRFQFLFWKLFV